MRCMEPSAHPLTDGQEVALTVLEPGALLTRDLRDAVDRLEAGYVVFLEHDPTTSQLRARCLEGIDGSPQLRVVARGRARRLEQFEPAVAAAVPEGLGPFLARLEAEFVCVVRLRPFQVFCRDGGIDVIVFEHVLLLSPPLNIFRRMVAVCQDTSVRL